MLGGIQLERPVVGPSRPHLLRLRHCIRHRPPPLRPTDDWQASSLRTVQGPQPVERRDRQNLSWHVLSNVDDGEYSDFHSRD